MSQVNVNTPSDGPSGNDRTAAAGINLITVVIVLVVLAALVWFLVTGPLQSLTSGTPTVNVNTPSQQQQPQQPNVNVNVNPGSGQQQQPAPAPSKP